jgi:hypothetical protein
MTKSKAVHMECSDNKTVNRKYSQRTIALNTKIQKTSGLCNYVYIYVCKNTHVYIYTERYKQSVMGKQQMVMITLGQKQEESSPLQTTVLRCSSVKRSQIKYKSL